MKTASIKLFAMRAIMILSGGFFLYAAILEANASSHNGSTQSSASRSAKSSVSPQNKASTPSRASNVNEGKDPLKDVQNILVHIDANGQLATYNFPNAGKDIEYIVFYLASGGCPRCRAFSPTLIQTYNTLKREKKNFEVVLVDCDRSEADMVNYMRHNNMPFPAIQFDLRKQAAVTNMYQGISIPALVIIDRTGKIRSTNANSSLRTADDVLTDLARLAH